MQLQTFIVTKREFITMLCEKLLEKYIKRINANTDCFRQFHEVDYLVFLKKDCEKLIDICNETIEEIEQVNK